MTISAGVVGLGIVSNRIIAQFDRHPDVELVAVCDVDGARVQRFTEERRHVAGFTDYRDLVALEALDLVYVATPPAHHADVVMAALQAGKHVLCEKPLANSLEEAARMLTTAKSSGRVHALHFPLQYSPEMYEFERLYQSGYLGELRRVEVLMQFPEWPRPWQQNAWVGGRTQGGYTLEVGVHFIQAIQRVFGPIRDIAGSMTYPADETACEISVLAEGTLPEVGDGRVRALFNGFSQAGGKERVELNAYGTAGTLSLQSWSKLFSGRRGEDLALVRVRPLPETLTDHVVRAIHGAPAVLCDFQVGYEAQQVLEALRCLAD
ncbi:MAG: Gfo/Idh/MocA family oxidoreductase [Alicyclobacillus sp.]|nr:Gfo/Idh/MocA family oxidoreductase [Alicyclobacillus sp.]